MRERSLAVNALIGAAVTIVLTFIPFSSVLGGGVAGYLRGGDIEEGVRVGALSGLFALVPLFLLFAVIGTVVSVGLIGVGAARMLALGGLFAVVVLFFVVVYVVGLSALGGAVGAAIRDRPGGDELTQE